MEVSSRNILSIVLLSTVLLGIFSLNISFTISLDEKQRTLGFNHMKMTNAESITLDSDLIQITTNERNNYNPSIFKDAEERLWMVWGNGTGNDGIIWASYASNPFINWSIPFRLTHDPADDWNPVGVMDKRGVLWIFWQSNRNGNYDIWYKNSATNGRTWSQAFQLTNQLIDETRPISIVDHSDSLWVFYEVNNGGNKDLEYKKTQLDTRTWEPSQLISLSDPIRQEEIYDACIGEKGTIYLFVQELRDRWGVFIWLTEDLGQNWEKHQVTDYENNGWGTIFLRSSRLYLVYEQQWDFYLTYSSLSKWKWSEGERVTSVDTFNLHPQCCTGINSHIFLVWSSNRTGVWEIYLKVIKSEIAFQSGTALVIPFPLVIFFILLPLIFIFISMMSLLLKYENSRFRIRIDDSILLKILSFVFLILGNVIGPRIRRMSFTQVQDNTVRHEILELLSGNEFLHFRELQRQTQVGMAQLKWHLMVLRDFGLVGERRIGQYLIYFLSSNPPDSVFVDIYFNLLTPTSFHIAKAFIEFPKWDINELAIYLKISRKLLRYHCSKMLQLGILDEEKQNHFILKEKYRDSVIKVISRKNREGSNR